MPRASFREIITEKEFWLLVLIGVIYFYKPLFLDETFFFRDLYSHFYPHKKLLIEYWNQHSLPLWDPYFQGGTPFLGNINNNVLYPSNVLYFVVPTVTAFNLDLIIHVIFCSLATYTFSRIVGLSKPASLLAGVIYGYCGYTLSHINLFIRLLAMPYLPLLLAFWHLYLLENKKRWFILSIAAGVIQLLAGAAEMVLITLFTAFGWTVFFPYQKSFARKITAFALLLFFVGGIAAVQILPTAEMITRSQRWKGIDFAQFSSWSVNPRRLPELVIPKFSGRTDSLTRKSYWGDFYEDEDHPYIVSIYAGWIPILLAFAAGFIRSENESLPSHIRRFFFVLCIGSILLSLGRHLPGFQLLYHVVPLISVFRYPVKFLLAAVFPLAILAAYAFDWILSSKNQNKNLTTIFIGTTILMIALTAITILSPKFSTIFQKLFYASDHGTPAQIWLIKAFVHASVVLIFATFVFNIRNWRVVVNPAWLLVIVVTADLLIAGMDVNPYAPREFLTAEPQIVSVIRKELKDGRLYRAPIRHARLRAPSDDIVWGQRWDLEVLNFYLASFYKIPVIFHDDIYGMASTDQMQLKDAVEGLPWDQKIKLLSTAGVSLVLTSENLTMPELQKLVILQNKSDTLFYLYRNKMYSGRARFISDQEACKHVQIKTSPVNLTSTNFRIQNDCPGTLVFSDVYYPGWKIKVNDKQTKLEVTPSGFTALRLAAGNHSLHYYYFPKSLITGFIISITSFGLFIFYLLVGEKLQSHSVPREKIPVAP